MNPSIFDRRTPVAPQRWARHTARLLFSFTISSASSFLIVDVARSEPAAPVEDVFQEDVPVVLTASRLSQPINEAPVAITVIDQQMIRDSGAWDISEVMRLVPGMYVAYHADPFYSSDSTVAYHGLVTTSMSNRMQVLIDGRSVYSILFGGVNWNDLPITLQDIERIEVIRGPASASYGANSFSGVINIITRHPAESQASSISVATGPGRTEGQFHYGGKSGALMYRLTVALRNDQGLEDRIHRPANHKPQDVYWTYNKYDNKTIQLLNWRGDYQINAEDTLEMQLGYNGGARQSGEYNNFSAVNKSARNHFEMLHWRRALDNDGEISVQAFHTQERIYARLADSDGISYGDAILRRYDLEVQHTFSPLKNVRLVSGGSLRYDKIYAPYYLGVGNNQYLFGDFPFRLQRLFANAEWRALPSLVFNVGGMFEHNSYTATDVTPRVAVNWQFVPGHTLRVGFTKATRTPSVYEKIYEGYLREPGRYPSLPVLRPERVSSSEIGYMGKIAGVDIDLRLFNDEVTELLGVNRIKSISYYSFNSGNARLRGYEAQLKWAPTDRTRVIYGISGGGVHSPDTNGIVYSDSLPRTSQSLMVSHQINNAWDASITGYQTSKTHFNATDYNLVDQRAYYLPLTRRWDARVAHRFSLYGKSAELSLIVQNLADAHFFEYRHDNEFPGRLARFEFKLDL